MSLPVILTEKADLEFDEAAAWYERTAGLGEAFVDRIERVLDRIGRLPEATATIYRDIRRVRVQRFPYGVFYRKRDDRIEVIAVLHNKRDPSIWQSRA